MNRFHILAALAVIGSVVCWAAPERTPEAALPRDSARSAAPEPTADVPGLIVRDHDEFEWKASGSLPPGAEYHLLFEDPKTHAVQIMVRFKGRYRIPSHHHTNGETLVVTRGKLGVDFGSGERVLGPGSFIRIPPGLPHATRAAGLGACEMLVLMTGPYDVLGLDAAKAR